MNPKATRKCMTGKELSHPKVFQPSGSRLGQRADLSPPRKSQILCKTHSEELVGRGVSQILVDGNIYPGCDAAFSSGNQFDWDGRLDSVDERKDRSLPSRESSSPRTAEPVLENGERRFSPKWAEGEFWQRVIFDRTRRSVRAFGSRRCSTESKSKNQKTKSNAECEPLGIKTKEML